VGAGRRQLFRQTAWRKKKGRPVRVSSEIENRRASAAK
jgi:hypothetical protein